MRNLRFLLKINFIRYWLTRFRVFLYVRILRRLKTLNSEDSFEVTVKHNLKGLYHCNLRMELLIKPLSVIESLDRNSKILVIGPRNEHDIFLLGANGFNLHNVKGLDLISYSRYIDVGDMHDMNYDDEEFDAVIFGWTLSYSSNPLLACQEITRITRPGGIIAVGVEYSELTATDSEELIGYSIQEYSKLSKRINNVGEILALFDGHVSHVYFNHDAPMKRSHTAKGLISNVSNVSVIFSKK